jgi:hypothetical protein
MIFNYIILARNAVQVHEGGVCQDEDMQHLIMPLNQVFELVRSGEINGDACLDAIYKACERIEIIRLTAQSTFL